MYHSWLSKKFSLGIKPDKKEASQLAVFSVVAFNVLFISSVMLLILFLCSFLEVITPDLKAAEEFLYTCLSVAAISLPLSIYYIAQVVEDFTFLKAARKALSNEKKLDVVKISESPEYYTTTGLSPREEYYREKFQEIEAGKKRIWSWDAAFFTINWLAYRKMYAYSFISSVIFSSIFIILNLSALFFLNATFEWGVINLVAFPFFGFYGNSLYHSWLSKKSLLGVKPDEKNTSFLAVFSSGFFNLFFISSVSFVLILYLCTLQEFSATELEKIKGILDVCSKAAAISLPLSIYYIVNVIRDFSFLKAARKARSKKKQMEPYRKW